MTLQLSEAVEGRLGAAARARGVDPASLALELLISAVESMTPATAAVKNPQLTGEAFLEALRRLPGSVSGLSNQTFDRAMIYEDHD